MNELNRPLGVKSQARKGPKPARSGNLLGLVSLLFAVAAMGLAGWLYLAKEPPIQIAGVPAADSPSQENSEETEDNPAAPPGNETDDEPADESAAENQGVTGLTPLQPSGNIAVPEPRPPRAAPQEAGLAHLPDPELVERGATGAIPRRSHDGRKPMDVYAREPDTTGNFGVARVVLIVGGIGISQTSSQEAVRKLPGTVTLAFAATGNSLMRWMQAARKKGHELLLQVPMEPYGASGNPAGSRLINSAASAEENLANLHWAMSRITNYVGIMNYQGGKLLSEPGALKPVFDEIAGRGLLFVDDGSSGANRSKAVADASLLPYARAHILIDAKRTRQDIAKQLEALVKEAKRTGLAIGVSNGYSETIDMIADFSSRANALGVEITPVSAIVSDPERQR
ncbi:divergent polysaccharide deacetylase family protein [Salaquimonas pukyongi]|uniref:divergent polysaccharide deacetylase family protein n=1 Tax=Salaquimonas pukyongi TaxID=2712698 RepID=UPI00096B9BF4|nr:divergent polysaccharide deacetylase family protein [Salaquimonas pukyongi]